MSTMNISPQKTPLIRTMQHVMYSLNENIDDSEPEDLLSNLDSRVHMYAEGLEYDDHCVESDNEGEETLNANIPNESHTEDAKIEICN